MSASLRGENKFKVLVGTGGWCFDDYSPIWTVILSHGDVSDFHHLQGVVGDLIAVRIQNVGVYLSPPA